jgi:hypothetical protein
MSCAGKGYGKAQQSNAYLYSQFVDSNMRSIASGTNSGRNILCPRLKNGYPSFTPIINGLSITTSVFAAYSLVYVTGGNFLPNGTTFIQFGTFGYIPAIFYSSSSISFVVPLYLEPKKYNIKVVNLYNNNFSLGCSQKQLSNLIFSSNYITYTVT